MAQKGAAPDDIMSNVIFQVRWADVIKLRSEELVKQKIVQPLGLFEDSDTAADSLRVDQTLRGSKGVERCAHDSQDYWDSFAAQLVRPVSYTHLTLPTIYSV